MGRKIVPQQTGWLSCLSVMMFSLPLSINIMYHHYEAMYDDLFVIAGLALQTIEENKPSSPSCTDS
jgi:hypothetical protein